MTLRHKTLWYSKMVEMTVYLVSPLTRLYGEFSSGLYFCIKYFSFCFLSMILSVFQMET